MMTQTHAVTGLAVWMSGDTLIRAFGVDHPYYMTVAGALLAWAAAKAPDIDNPDSRPGRQINRLLPGASDAVQALLGHRGATHWVATGVVNGAALGLIAFLVVSAWWFIGLAVSVGWLTHIAGDCITYRGAPAFGPFRRTPVRLPYGYRIKVGGPIEVKIVYPAAVVWAMSMSAASVALAVCS